MMGSEVLGMIGAGCGGDVEVDGNLITREMVDEFSQLEFSGEEVARLRGLLRSRTIPVEAIEEVDLGNLGLTEAEVMAAKELVAQEVRDELDV